MLLYCLFCLFFFCLMIRRPPRSTRTDTSFPTRRASDLTVKDLTGGRGADLILDPVGGDVFDESTRCIAFDGRLLVVGFASGRIPQISVNRPLIDRKSTRLNSSH